MESNTHSAEQLSRPSAGPPDGLTALAAAVDQLATEDLTCLPEAERAQRILGCGGSWTARKASG
jgi:hypothetical protein